MKNINKVLISIASLSLLAGCSSTTTTQVSSSSDVYFTVGKTKVTKGDVYKYMKLQNLASGIIGMAEDDIASSVEITDEMSTTVDERIAADKELYGEETFNTMLSYYGFADEQAYRDAYILNMQMTQLTQDYIEDNWDDMLSRFTPVKGFYLSFTDDAEDTTGESDEDTSDESTEETSDETSEQQESQASINANAALAALQDGSKEVSDIINEYSLSDTGESQIYTSASDIDSDILTYMINHTTGYSDVIFVDGDTPTYYIVYVESNNAEDFKDDLLDTLSSNSDVATEADQYLLRSHNFTVYDDLILTSLRSDYNDYLSDSQKAETTESN